MTHNELGHFDWLREWARLAPAKVAVKDGDSGRCLSYFDLYQLSGLLSQKLESTFQLKRGDRIGLLATNELESVVLFFASLRLGTVLVPINFRLTGRELDHILNDSDPGLLIAQAAFIPTIETCKFKSQNFLFEDLQKMIDEMIISVRKSRSSYVPANLKSDQPDHPCMILYTSGTTGAPKGAMITPRMLHWNSINTTLRLNLSETDVFVSFLPFFHTGGWNVLLTPFMHRGATVVLTKKFDAERVLSLCESEKVTIMFGVPTTMEMMSRSPAFQSCDLRRVRYAIVGGEPMPIELIRRWQEKGIPIRQGFGLTEFGPNVFSLDESDAVRKIGSIGSPNFYVEARIVDESRKDVSPGQIGELILKGPVCTPGYWNNPSATAAAIVDGWFYTGDLVRTDSDGYFYVAGRKKDMYISGGENVYPVEVETVLSQHPAVREVAVIGIPDAKWGEVGCAYIALTEKEVATAEQIIAFCSDKLAKFKIPKIVHFLPALPKGDSGKILKRHLRQSVDTRSGLS